MSARHRFLCGTLACCLIAIVFVSPVWGQALDSTPRITRGTCPAEHCNLGLWQSAVALPVYAAPGAAQPAFRLRPRIPFEALGGETHAVPGVHVLRAKLEVVGERTTRSLRRGDTIRTVAYLGEGRFRVEAGGASWVAVMDDRDATRFQTVRPRRETWWVEIKAPDGRRGWIDGGDPDIAGETFDESLPPLSAAMLDSAFLVGVTGPVAAIVKEGGSVATFEAPIEDADAQGAAWWNGDRLRMLHLRFSALLTGRGTTRPEQSGLPSSAVVCCGDLVYHRLMVFTRREPEYVATITVPEKGERHVVEAFFQGGRMVRLLRDARAVPIAYSDSVMGRAWYSAARALAQEVATNAATARPASAAGNTPSSGRRSVLGRRGLVGLAIVVAVVLAAIGAWLWKRRPSLSPPWRKRPAPAAAPEAPPPEEEGWVCPYCQADVLLDLQACWLCGRPRPGTTPAPAELICGCGEPNPPGAKSCRRCGKSFRLAF